MSLLSLLSLLLLLYFDIFISSYFHDYRILGADFPPFQECLLSTGVACKQWRAKIVTTCWKTREIVSRRSKNEGRGCLIVGKKERSVRIGAHRSREKRQPSSLISRTRERERESRLGAREAKTKKMNGTASNPLFEMRQPLRDDPPAVSQHGWLIVKP